jgi:hypothetical protein
VDVNEIKGQVWYACFVAGTGFPGLLIGKEQPVGFYTTRFVRASTVEDAETQAILDLRADERLRLPDGVAGSEEASIRVEECVVISEYDVPSNEEGLVWFEMD